MIKMDDVLDDEEVPDDYTMDGREELENDPEENLEEE